MAETSTTAVTVNSHYPDLTFTGRTEWTHVICASDRSHVLQILAIRLTTTLPHAKGYILIYVHSSVTRARTYPTATCECEQYVWTRNVLQWLIDEACRCQAQAQKTYLHFSGEESYVTHVLISYSHYKQGTHATIGHQTDVLPYYRLYKQCD
jgi:hypothetical protein